MNSNIKYRHLSEKNNDFISTFVGKEARKKELKKNKKQRQMVRAAVLKGKDPAQLIEEMEKIDEMGNQCHITSSSLLYILISSFFLYRV